MTDQNRKNQMPFELDHIFICTDVDAPAAKRLTDFGITEGPSNLHPGQGTANRRFFFGNAMLELLWVHNPDEAQTERTYPTRLWDRWRNRGKEASPFGICLRATQPNGSEQPFLGWAYKPIYLPDTLSILVGNNSDLLHEPMLFYLKFGRRPDQQERFQQFLDHPIGFREVTALRIPCCDAKSPSPALRSLIEAELVTFLPSGCSAVPRRGNRHLMEIGFDGETQGKSVHFLPELPLVLKF